MGKGPNPHGSDRNGWTMTGGVTVFSKTSFEQCTFGDFSSEDSLNIVSSSFFPFSSAHLVQVFLTPLTEIRAGELIGCQFKGY